MDFDKIAMVQAETLFVGKLEGNKNFLFCQNSALMVGNSVRFSDYFLFHLSTEEERFTRLTKEMFDFGCSSEFIEHAREARKSGAMYILYFV
jgi:hypothetical protein